MKEQLRPTVTDIIVGAALMLFLLWVLSYIIVHATEAEVHLDRQHWQCTDQTDTIPVRCNRWERKMAK